jgi:regulatory protein
MDSRGHVCQRLFVFLGLMMVERRITALEVQKHNKERVNVYLDGEFAFGLPILNAATLHKGQLLTEDEIAALRAIDDVTRAVDQAVTLLARRPYSTTEIRRHLNTKKIAPEVIEEALIRLAQLGYVDDRAFASYWIENREQFRPRGARALRYELQQKGIPQDIINEALEVFDAHDAAYRAAQEQARRLRGLAEDEFRNKLGAFLARRGFEYEIVREVIDQFVRELEDENPETFDSD